MNEKMTIKSTNLVKINFITLPDVKIYLADVSFSS